ncbi:DUF3842 family protein [Clostridium sp.]|jgi:hypothetical protein|uniref:DUF3842 family protein n=1 Tax=Clostridium sp. TaxID=1506 RepID=UPI002589BC70|nr:DUF3842 family protein [Clostridium sp.]MDF2502826.1 hypothetical protein [Clostridium sp.]
MKIAILDAQGAGIGQTVIKKLRKELGTSVHITALGTNKAATNNMLHAGANIGISGEPPICLFCKANHVDCIIGPIGIICSGGIAGEITPMLSESIFNMNCIKYILPLKKHGIYIPGTRHLQIKEIIDEIILDIKNRVNTY